jgi:hypothetical protein
MNPVSTQSRAVANRSTMPASRVTISGNFSIILPQRNSAVLCAIASKRLRIWWPPPAARARAARKPQHPEDTTPAGPRKTRRNRPARWWCELGSWPAAGLCA